MPQMGNCYYQGFCTLSIGPSYEVENNFISEVCVLLQLRGVWAKTFFQLGED
jgi:hypothetical protein